MLNFLKEGKMCGVCVCFHSHNLYSKKTILVQCLVGNLKNPVTWLNIILEKKTGLSIPQLFLLFEK